MSISWVGIFKYLSGEMIDSERAFWLCSPLPSLTPPRPSQFPRSSCFSSEAENLSSLGPGHRAPWSDNCQQTFHWGVRFHQGKLNLCLLFLYCWAWLRRKVNYWPSLHIASKLTIVSKFYQIVRVEKCALNKNNTIPTQSIILSDHVVGKMCI